MRALHLASFDGNIGDMANHKGFWNLFRKYVTDDVEVTYLEMREFYKSWNLRKYDEKLVDYINTFDFFVVGGGNFFDVHWDYSDTGVTFGLSPDLLQKINVPVIFNGVGVEFVEHDHLDANLKKFEKLMDFITTRENMLVSVRNDGSMELLESAFGNRYSSVYSIPDSGFFTTAKAYEHPEIPDGHVCVAINAAKDKIHERWGSEEGYADYCKEFAAFINDFLEENKNAYITFVPHIPTDVLASYEIIQYIKDPVLRRQISIAPCLNGNATPGDYPVDLYRKADAVIGMRYHSNICAIAMGTPNIGTVTMKKHFNLFANIGMENRLCDIQHGNFAGHMKEMVNNALANKEEMIRENQILIEKLEEEERDYFERMKELLGV